MDHGGKHCRHYGPRKTEVPGCFPANTTSVDLSGNRWSFIPRTTFESCKFPRMVNLSSNNISVIESFPPGLVSLQVLVRQDKILNFSALSGDVFTALSGLEVLNVSFNQMWLTSPLENLSRNYRGEFFSSLPSLGTLVMDSLPFPFPFPMEFGNLTSLEHLKLRANMTNVRNETFAVFSRFDIKTLTIWSGFLVHLDALSFAHFRVLAELVLSYNPLVRFNELSTAWYGLQFTNISELYLMYMGQFGAEVVTLFYLFTNIFRLGGPITINVFYLGAQWNKIKIAHI